MAMTWIQEIRFNTIPTTFSISPCRGTSIEVLAISPLGNPVLVIYLSSVIVYSVRDMHVSIVRKYIVSLDEGASWLLLNK